MRIASLTALIAACAVIAHAATPAKTPAKPFDARDPAALVSLLTTMAAKAEITRSAAGSVFLDIKTPGGDFGAQFVDCDAKGVSCRAVVFSTAFATRDASFAQMNSFNKGQVACRGYIADDGRPNVAYATLVNLRVTTDEMKQHIGLWQGCLGTFSRAMRHTP